MLKFLIKLYGIRRFCREASPLMTGSIFTTRTLQASTENSMRHITMPYGTGNSSFFTSRLPTGWVLKRYQSLNLQLLWQLKTMLQGAGFSLQCALQQILMILHLQLRILISANQCLTETLWILNGKANWISHNVLHLKISLCTLILLSTNFQILTHLRPAEYLLCQAETTTLPSLNFLLNLILYPLCSLRIMYL